MELYSGYGRTRAAAVSPSSVVPPLKLNALNSDLPSDGFTDNSFDRTASNAERTGERLYKSSSFSLLPPANEPYFSQTIPSEHFAETVSPRHRARESMAELGIECAWDDGDLFYMYVYKVMLCPKKYSHEWSACPFAHKGERATRRDPRSFTYSAASCPDFKSGSCPRGDLCPYSHGVFEACLHPERYRTQLCNSGATCKRSVCFFAHSLNELRSPSAGNPAAGHPSIPPSGQLQALHQLLSTRGSVPPDVHALIDNGRGLSSEQLLRAQLASYQQALGTLSNLLASNAAGTGQAAAVQLLAQAQRQSALAALLPASQPQAMYRAPVHEQHLQTFQQPLQPQGYMQHMPPMHSMSYSSVDSIQNKMADGLAGELEARLSMADQSPRTPFERGSSAAPSPSQEVCLPRRMGSPLGSRAAPADPHDDLSPEDRLPSHLMDSL
eukprot:CAMPEP_0177597850 /NCGR_PEP_ID=MMETSP0419_2-20121207/11964_1 /TAXON_ID=582737 /ORGANISM="Tetraselmis sp., Strain GSL018" /LENGTH=439 /DNA_ID=CAMNT_0019090113 /DNA_START=385 /DNA_END=1704 /DNA_ORIENTATION=-